MSEINVMFLLPHMCPLWGPNVPVCSGKKMQLASGRLRDTDPRDQPETVKGTKAWGSIRKAEDKDSNEGVDKTPRGARWD